MPAELLRAAKGRLLLLGRRLLYCPSPACKIQSAAKRVTRLLLGSQSLSVEERVGRFPLGRGLLFSGTGSDWGPDGRVAALRPGSGFGSGCAFWRGAKQGVATWKFGTPPAHSKRGDIRASLGV